jgi:fructosamine-3-kinase
MRSPDALLKALTETIRELWGASLAIRSVESVSGGDINEAARIVLSDGRALFLKYNLEPLPRLFEVEARGLALLRDTRTVRVPDVYAVRALTENHPAFLLMEWLPPGSSRAPDVMRGFGRKLARLHQHTSNAHGLDHDNYIGSLPQRNTPTRSWVEFYREHRLGAQRELAGRLGRLPTKREETLERLMERLDELIDESSVRPSLLHGDLWGGNYLISKGEAVLIDPAVYYGDREVELAFTELFGGFSPEFYEGYSEIWPLDTGYEERKALYQLYPLLVHLNLFGESYGASVDRILRRYAG